MTSRAPVSAAPAVRVEHLTVVRGRTRAVDDVSFELGGGDAGRPAGAERVREDDAHAIPGGHAGGELGDTIALLGEPAGSPALRDRVGYVTQLPSVYGDLTVRENLSYFATVLGAPSEAVESVLADVDLGRPCRFDGRAAVGWRTSAGVAGHRAVGFAAPSGARRADGRPRPAAAPEPVVALPRASGRRDDPARLQPRHGRGRAL